MRLISLVEHDGSSLLHSLLTGVWPYGLLVAIAHITLRLCFVFLARRCPATTTRHFCSLPTRQHANTPAQQARALSALIADIVYNTHEAAAAAAHTINSMIDTAACLRSVLAESTAQHTHIMFNVYRTMLRKCDAHNVECIVIVLCPLHHGCMRNCGTAVRG